MVELCKNIVLSLDKLFEVILDWETLHGEPYLVIILFFHYSNYTRNS